MPSLSYMNGYSSVHPPFAVVQCNYDGADPVEELKDELDKMSDEPECQGRPVPIYYVSGTLGAISTEVIYMYMFGGVPLILDPGIVVEGSGTDDAMMVNRSGRFVTEMFMHGNDHVFSIGYVDDPCDAYSYAVEYTRRQVPTKDTSLDADMVNSYLSANPYSMTHVGTIQRPGGTMFEVYAIGSTESAMFRPDKDFMGGEPDVENDRDGVRGRIEVLLCGGDPDIVCIGAICGLDGWLFNVWVPNEAEYIDCGTKMLAQNDIPHDVLYIDEDELAQAYLMYDEKLRHDEMEAEGIDTEEDETDVPNFDYEEYYSEEFEDRNKPEPV